MHAWCATTSKFYKSSCPLGMILTIHIDIPWIDNTHVSLSCEWEKNECIFQFWKDREEQFYCELSECSQSGNYHFSN